MLVSWVSPCVTQWPGFDPPELHLSHHRQKRRNREERYRETCETRVFFLGLDKEGNWSSKVLVQIRKTEREKRNRENGGGGLIVRFYVCSL